jgi:hypothetical protein
MNDFTDLNKIHVSFEEYKNLNTIMYIRDLFGSINSLHRKIFSILNDRNSFYNHVSRFSK